MIRSDEADRAGSGELARAALARRFGRRLRRRDGDSRRAEQPGGTLADALAALGAALRAGELDEVGRLVGVDAEKQPTCLDRHRHGAACGASRADRAGHKPSVTRTGSDANEAQYLCPARLYMATASSVE